MIGVSKDDLKKMADPTIHKEIQIETSNPFVGNKGIIGNDMVVADQFTYSESVGSSGDIEFGAFESSSIEFECVLKDEEVLVSGSSLKINLEVDKNLEKESHEIEIEEEGFRVSPLLLDEVHNDGAKQIMALSYSAVGYPEPKAEVQLTSIYDSWPQYNKHVLWFPFKYEGGRALGQRRAGYIPIHFGDGTTFHNIPSWNDFVQKELYNRPILALGDMTGTNKPYQWGMYRIWDFGLELNIGDAAVLEHNLYRKSMITNHADNVRYKEVSVPAMVGGSKWKYENLDYEYIKSESEKEKSDYVRKVDVLDAEDHIMFGGMSITPYDAAQGRRRDVWFFENDDGDPTSVSGPQTVILKGAVYSHITYAGNVTDDNKIVSYLFDCPLSAMVVNGSVFDVSEGGPYFGIKFDLTRANRQELMNDQTIIHLDRYEPQDVYLIYNKNNNCIVAGANVVKNMPLGTAYMPISVNEAMYGYTIHKDPPEGEDKLDYTSIYSYVDEVFKFYLGSVSDFRDHLPTGDDGLPVSSCGLKGISYTIGMMHVLYYQAFGAVLDRKIEEWEEKLPVNSYQVIGDLPSKRTREIDFIVPFGNFVIDTVEKQSNGYSTKVRAYGFGSYGDSFKIPGWEWVRRNLCLKGNQDHIYPERYMLSVLPNVDISGFNYGSFYTSLEPVEIDPVPYKVYDEEHPHDFDMEKLNFELVKSGVGTGVIIESLKTLYVESLQAKVQLFVDKFGTATTTMQINDEDVKNPKKVVLGQFTNNFTVTDEISGWPEAGSLVISFKYKVYKITPEDIGYVITENRSKSEGKHWDSASMFKVTRNTLADCITTANVIIQKLTNSLQMPDNFSFVNAKALSYLYYALSGRVGAVNVIKAPTESMSYAQLLCSDIISDAKFFDPYIFNANRNERTNLYWLLMLPFECDVKFEAWETTLDKFNYYGSNPDDWYDYGSKKRFDLGTVAYPKKYSQIKVEKYEMSDETMKSLEKDYHYLAIKRIKTKVTTKGTDVEKAKTLKSGYSASDWKSKDIITTTKDAEPIKFTDMYKAYYEYNGVVTRTPRGGDNIIEQGASTISRELKYPSIDLLPEDSDITNVYPEDGTGALVPVIPREDIESININDNTKSVPYGRVVFKIDSDESEDPDDPDIDPTDTTVVDEWDDDDMHEYSGMVKVPYAFDEFGADLSYVSELYTQWKDYDISDNYWVTKVQPLMGKKKKKELGPDDYEECAKNVAFSLAGGCSYFNVDTTIRNHPEIAAGDWLYLSDEDGKMYLTYAARVSHTGVQNIKTSVSVSGT